MHEIFETIPLDKIAKVQVGRVVGDKVEWLDNASPKLTLADVRETHGPGEYEFRAFMAGNRPVAGPSGTVRLKIAGPPLGDDEDDDEDDEDDDDDDEDDDKDDEKSSPHANRYDPPGARPPHAAQMPRTGFAPSQFQQPGMIPGAMPGMMQGMMMPNAPPLAPLALLMMQFVQMGLSPKDALDAARAAMPDAPSNLEPSGETSGRDAREARRLATELDSKDEELRALKRRHDRALSDAQDQHQQDLRRVSAESAERIATMRAEHNEQIRSLQDEHRKAITRLENETEERLSSLKKRLTSETDMSTMPMQNRLSMLTAENSRLMNEVERLRGELTRVESENRQLQRDLEKKDMHFQKTTHQAALERERDEFLKERERASLPSGGEGESTPANPMFTGVKELVGMVPMIAQAVQTMNKLNSGEPITPNTAASNKPAAATVRAGGAAPSPAAPPPPAPMASPNVAPPRVTPPTVAPPAPPTNNNVS